MPGPSSLSELQGEQKEHDKRCHPDVFYKFTMAQAMNHFEGHQTKYAARFVDADAGRLEDVARKTVADSSIVSLASANTLQMSLSRSMQEEYGTPSEPGIQGYAGDIPEHEDREELRRWMVYGLIEPNGRIAKALDTHDHMEDDVEIRDTMENGVRDLMKHNIDISVALEMDPVDLIQRRWNEIENNNIS